MGRACCRIAVSGSARRRQQALHRLLHSFEVLLGGDVPEACTLRGQGWSASGCA